MNKELPDSLQCSVIEIGRKGSWQVSGFPRFLEKNTIHVWSARYEDLDCHFTSLSNVISTDQKNIAFTFRTSDNAKKYVLRHGLVRSILGRYIRHNPETVAFFTGRNGKPELDLQGSYADISFNLSHTSDMVLIGVTWQRRIGVDIVRMNLAYRFDDTAGYMLTPAEQAILKKTAPDLRYEVFFRMWAAKEAILKATGGTLTLMKKTDLSDIFEDGGYSPEYSMNYLDSQPPFFLWQFMVGSRHRGAVAVDAGNARYQ